MVGTTVHQYEILEQIGSGGMGVVFKARDTKLDRTVALKFLPAKAASDAAAKERFIQEAKAASSLDDPHICTIFDIGEADDGQLFIVMAFYDGATLKDLMEKRQIKLEDAASIALQMGKGLSTAHEAGIIHRDVKPANVMVTKKGLVKLLDFGVAKLSESSDLTREGSTIGTAAYMSPEQAKGETLDARSDVWSIGAVLYEMITGSRPFGGGYEAAVAYSIINENPPPIAPARPDTPDGLVAVVQKALSKDPAVRYPTAKALADDLAKYSGETIVETAEQPVVASPVSVPSLQRVMIRFTAAAVIVLGAVYGAMIGFGLPDWVFPTAVLLVLLGLPIMLLSVSVEKQRHRMDSGEKAKLSGIRSWLTTRLAIKGGVIAGSLLLVAVVGYTVLRAAGIGPFASLITSGALSAQDRILVADFENRTEDPDVGVAITGAFKIDLGQSEAIRLMDRSAVQSALVRMGVNPDTAITRDLALEIAQREGVKAIIEGDITSAGASFIINARVLSAVDGSQLVGIRQNADDDRALLPAIDRLSADLREGIGESLISIRGNEPLEQVTTSSLAALRLYTEGVELASKGQEDAAIEIIKKAVEADSLFAMSYRKLAVLYGNTGAGSTLVDSMSQIAYNLRDRLPQRERLLTEANYWSTVGDDEEEEIRTYEEVLKRYPYDITALNNLARRYNGNRRFEEGETLLRRALEEGEVAAVRANLVNSVVLQGRLDDALQELDDYDAAIPNLFSTATARLQVHFMQDDFEHMEAWMDSADARPKQSDEEDDMDGIRQGYRLSRGKIREFTQAFERRFQENLDENEAEELADGEVYYRQIDSLYFVAFREGRIAQITGDTRELISLIDQIEDWIENAEDLPEDQNPYSGLWRLATQSRDWERAREYIDQTIAFQTVLRGEPNEFISMWDLVVQAFITKDMDDVRTAVDAFEEYYSSSSCSRCYRMEIGELYEAVGEMDRAIEMYETFATAPQLGALFQDSGRVGVVQFRLGALYEQKGDLDAAITWYSKMIDRWIDADAELQPQVEEARRRIEVLLDRKAQEG